MAAARSSMWPSLHGDRLGIPATAGKAMYGVGWRRGGSREWGRGGQNGEGTRAGRGVDRVEEGAVSVAVVPTKSPTPSQV